MNNCLFELGFSFLMYKASVTLASKSDLHFLMISKLSRFDFLHTNYFFKCSLNSDLGSAFLNSKCSKLLQFCESYNLVSFDVSYLFTNVLLDETVGLIADCVYGSDSEKVTPFPKKWSFRGFKFLSLIFGAENFH